MQDTHLPFSRKLNNEGQIKDLIFFTFSLCEPAELSSSNRSSTFLFLYSREEWHPEKSQESHSPAFLDS